MNSTLSQLLAWMPETLLTADATFAGVSTDTRQPLTDTLFVALRGERFDAHDFLDDVAEKGAAAVMVEVLPENYALPAIVVPDTREAMAKIAQAWRAQFDLPVIAVTGSNGKTTVKEMIATILTTAFGLDQVLATQGNLNNDIGVPLTLFGLNAQHQAAVVELGMNHVGEIAQLAAMTQPTVALVNNAQREHQEFMHSVESVAIENGAVIQSLPATGCAVFPNEDDFAPLWQDFSDQVGAHVTTFGLTPAAQVSGESDLAEFGSHVAMKIGSLTMPVKLAAAGLHNVKNALAAAACCHAIGIAPETIVKGLEAFAPVQGRMQRKVGKNGSVVIDDTYNANPDSALVAIDVLKQTPSPTIFVLGDMGEVGENGVRFHEEIGQYAKAQGVTHMLTLGELSRYSSRAFGAQGQHFEEVDVLMEQLKQVWQANTTVLVKGSRFMKMERVVHALENMAGGN